MIEQIRREHASMNGVRRQLGTGWRTVWESIKPLLAAPDADPCRFEGVKILGVDEHVRLNAPHRRRTRHLSPHSTVKSLFYGSPDTSVGGF